MSPWQWRSSASWRSDRREPWQHQQTKKLVEEAVARATRAASGATTAGQKSPHCGSARGASGAAGAS
eukprot:4000795-Alexandrium_andersonii.AAC.1